MAITLDGTDGIAAPNVFGYNTIINGDGSVNQRGYTSGTATTGANEYTLDRWRVVTSGESLTFTGNEAGRVMTAPSGGVEQVIEGFNIAGGTYVITWTGTATGAVDGTTVSSGDTVTLTANTNATVKFTSGTFTNVKVEEGSIATPFRKRGYGEELALCQRYFYRAADGTANTLGLGVYYRSTYMAGVVYFPVTMRALPTLNAASGTSYYEFIRDGAADYFNSLSLGNRSTPNIGEIYNKTEVSGTVGHGGWIRTDNAAVYVDFDAEL